MPLPGVLWIGGGTSAGKTRIARALAHRYGLTSYHVDDWELDHARRRDPQRHRGMEAWNARTLDETWVDLPVAKLVDETIAYSRERIELIEEDILPLSREGSVIAEGFQLMPEVVAPLIDSPRQAVWLLPTTRFRTETLLSTPGLGDAKSDARPPTRAGASDRARQPPGGENPRPSAAVRSSRDRGGRESIAGRDRGGGREAPRAPLVLEQGRRLYPRPGRTTMSLEGGGHIRRLTLVFGLVVGIAAAVASSAAAFHSWNDYHWARTANPFELKVGDNMSSSWDPYLGVASSDWSASSVLDTAIVPGGTNGKKCRATTGRVEVCNAAYGFRGWIGLAQIWISGSHITKAVAKMNDSYFDTSTYNKPEAKQSVLCQEIGHDFGLDHQSEDPKVNMKTCMDYYEGWNQHPNAHDYEELESIYAHLDSTSTVFSSATTDHRTEHVDREDRIKDSIVVEHLSDGSKRVTHIYWALPS